MISAVTEVTTAEEEGVQEDLVAAVAAQPQGQTGFTHVAVE